MVPTISGTAAGERVLIADLERINEEFRRRTKTQASLPSEEAVLLLLFGLIRSGQIILRRKLAGRTCAAVPTRSRLRNFIPHRLLRR
jgi:hypothetical protein